MQSQVLLVVVMLALMLTMACNGDKADKRVAEPATSTIEAPAALTAEFATATDTPAQAEPTATPASPVSTAASTPRHVPQPAPMNRRDGSLSQPRVHRNATAVGR